MTLTPRYLTAEGRMEAGRSTTLPLARAHAAQ